MTHDETRDELARMDGWTFDPSFVWHGTGRGAFVKRGAPNDDTQTIEWTIVHPHAPTLDGANAAVPECFKWRRFSDCWVATHDDCETVVEVPVTGETPEHKINDLYALALACRRAMEERK